MAANRPGDWHVLDLESDPTPGDPQRVKALSRELQDFADDVSDALRLVKGMASEEAVLKWAGKSAKAFQDEFEDVPKHLRKLEKSYGMAGDALAAFWPKLERAQALADKALVNGREAQADLKSAATRLTDADSWVGRATKESDDFQKDKDKKDAPAPDEDKVRAATRNAQSAKSAQGSAKSDVSSANSALDAAKKMAADARKMREDAAREAKDKLDEASDAGIKNRKWWEEVGDWVTDNWDTIVAVCKVVVAVLGIVAMIIGGPIALIVLAAALIVLADTLNKYAKGEASLWDVAFAALDCIPGMKGLTTLGGLAKGLKGGLAVARGGMKAMGKSVLGLAKSARGSIADGAKGAYNRLKSKVKGCGDPVDVATGYMFLDQTDVTLPGVLPLTFSRRAASDCRTGFWFGPSWSSTIDQRLEIDEEGVVFVTEDGMLLAYPHPGAPDAAVLPGAGPRWPLVRLDNGGYRIDDPLSGHSRRFTAPTGGLALLERIVDRNHNTIDFDYDADSTPISIRHSGGYHLAFTVEDGLITALSLVGAEEAGSEITVKRYGFTDGNLACVINSSGLPLQFTYDAGQRITSWTDTNGSRYSYTYDEQDRCTGQGGEAGHVAANFSYDGADGDWPGARITTVVTAGGATSRFVIDDQSLIVAVIDSLGGVVRTSYDVHGHLASVTDALGRTTALLNHPLGRPLEVTRADGAVIRYIYNKQMAPSSIVLPGGAVWRREYDGRGNCTAVTDPAGQSTHIAYDDRGGLASVTDRAGHTTQVQCDAAGLPITVTAPPGVTTRYVRDGFGRLAEVTDPLGAATRLDWTVEGKPSRRVAANGTTESWIYDGEGNCTSHTDPMGAVTQFEYTHFDLLTARVSPDGARYEFAHDSDLRLTKVTDPLGMNWTYRYDPAGRLISESDFDGRILTYAHDAVGRLIGRTNPLGQTVRYERDLVGQIIRKDVDGATTRFEYDLSGRIAHAVGADARFTLERDRAGRRRSETLNGRTLLFTHDELGRRVSRTTPTGVSSTWAYNAAGIAEQLTTGGRTVEFGHDLVGREVGRYFGGGLRLAHVFDELGRLTTQTVATTSGVTLQQRTYTYQADNHLIGMDDMRDGERTFDLNAAGRVTAVHARNWTESYAYDSAGNQTSALWPASHPGHEATGARDYTGCRITQAGHIRYEYDAAGRITLRQKAQISRKPATWRYTWDAEDQLTAVTTPDGSVWRYTYDPFGRRLTKQRLADDGETVAEQIDFTWDGSKLCEQTTTTDSALHPITLTWDHLGLHPITQTERIRAVDSPQDEIDSRFFAIVTDLVGTPTELIDEQGNIAWHTRTTLWGATAWAADSTAYTPLRFPGQYYDPETGLHYNHHRHYDPETARYLSPDPLGLSPAPNAFTYVHNPHTWSDPLGLAPSCSETGEYLYRGVPAGHPMYQQALEGTAVPRGGHRDPGRHAGGNTDSEFTSWTHDYEDVALDAADELGPGGIVMRIPRSEIPSSADNLIHGTDHEIYEEMEHAIEGSISGAEISVDRGPWRRP
ncbi:RHS repeat-associated core domain-containing protein [Streptomyces sp. A5-4]|uniref:RHS repeat-associated core domain-containing protein n=1 Tax=Streptomyces sp. A5-4 TaxID=3384771 RepID=UPI003DA8F68D